MTDTAPVQNPEPSARAKLAMTAADIGTVGLCMAFAVAACHQGPVTAGVTVAAVTLPILYSMMGAMGRYMLPSGHPFAEMGNYTGIKTTGVALKNICTDVKSLAIATTILGVFGVAAGGMVYTQEQNTRRWDEIEKRPTLPGDTLIPAQDLCGGKARYSYIKPYTAHDGKQYKIVCP